jgi:hypothetical protein
LIEVDFHLRSSMYDEWETFSSPHAAKILLLYLSARSG